MADLPEQVVTTAPELADCCEHLAGCRRGDGCLGDFEIIGRGKADRAAFQADFVVFLVVHGTSPDAVKGLISRRLT